VVGLGVGERGAEEGKREDKGGCRREVHGVRRKMNGGGDRIFGRSGGGHKMMRSETAERERSFVPPGLEVFSGGTHG
jgi:hypothetical protein